MTPLEKIELLLYYYKRTKGECCTMLMANHTHNRKELVADSLIIFNDVLDHYCVTNKGVAWVNAILAVPVPAYGNMVVVVIPPICTGCNHVTRDGIRCNLSVLKEREGGLQFATCLLTVIHDDVIPPTCPYGKNKPTPPTPTPIIKHKQAHQNIKTAIKGCKKEHANQAATIDDILLRLKALADTHTIHQRFNNSGKSWNAFEGQSLTAAFREFCAIMGAEHGRTPNAIKMRIEQNLTRNERRG